MQINKIYLFKKKTKKNKAIMAMHGKLLSFEIMIERAKIPFLKWVDKGD